MPRMAWTSTSTNCCRSPARSASGSLRRSIDALGLFQMIDIRSLRDLIRLYYIFHAEFRRAFWVTVVLAVAGAFLMSPKYTSEARLLVKAGRENLTVPLDTGDRQTFMSPSTQRDPIVDEEKMLTGRPVLTQVARLYLAELASAPPPQSWAKQLKAKIKGAFSSVGGAFKSGFAAIGLTEERSEEDQLADLLAKRFQVSHGPGSNVMEMSFTWSDPVIAQRIMTTWVRVYLDERTEALGRKSLVAFYEAKVRDADRQIDMSKGQLRTRLEKIQGVSAQERLDALTKRVNDLRTRRSEIVAERNALQQGISYAASRARSLPRESTSEREVGASPSWLALSGQLADLKRQRADALRVFKDTAPAIKSLNDSIASLEAQLKAEDKAVQRSEKRAPNELSMSMERNQLDKSVRLQEINTLYASFDKELTELEAARRAVLLSEPELDRLEQSLSVAEKSRGLYLDSLEKARIDQALDESRINNIAQIEAPTLNVARASPNSLLMLGMALPAGAVVGLLVVYLCSLMDQRIHDGGRVEQRFGVPLWSTLKDVDTGTSEDNEFHASLYRLYGMLPRERIAQQGLTLGLTSARPGEGVSFVAQRLAQLCQAQGMAVRLNPPDGPAPAGELFIREAAGLLNNREVFVRLGQADLIALVIEARASTVPVVDNALSILRTAYRQVDGVIVNRRRFEVPPRVLRWLQR
ncbi:MAG: lipopolysaccharide biosynthesis protein [Rubrivivax sp.]|nr:MAG: lipopolysaccharide biosynthesis protein [Rubrivivax sp.]